MVVAGAGVLIVASGDVAVGAGVAHVWRGRVGVVGVVGLVSWCGNAWVIAIWPLAIVRVRHANSTVQAGMGNSLAGLIRIYLRLSDVAMSTKAEIVNGRYPNRVQFMGSFNTAPQKYSDGVEIRRTNLFWRQDYMTRRLEGCAKLIRRLAC